MFLAFTWNGLVLNLMIMADDNEGHISLKFNILLIYNFFNKHM